MKKIFTLIAMALMAIGVNAETLISYSNASAVTSGITLGGSTAIKSVKIHTNADAVNCIQLANGYTTSEVLNENYIELSVDGGFKTGDKVTVAGFFNNSDDTKNSACDIFVKDSSEKGYTVLFTSAKFINGRLVADDPKEETYTLAADADKLYIGRNGNTGTNIYSIKVVRGEESSDPEPTPDPSSSDDGALISYDHASAVTSGITLGGSTAVKSVKIHTNADAVNCIQLANGYTTSEVLNENYIELSVDGGFKTGDKVTVAGFFNNSDDSKLSACDIFVKDSSEKGYTVLFTSNKFINGRLVADDPTEETYTLTADADKLYIGRNGNTGTNIYSIKVTRATSTGISEVSASAAKAVKAKKVVKNGRLVIETAAGEFSVSGARVK